MLTTRSSRVPGEGRSNRRQAVTTLGKTKKSSEITTATPSTVRDVNRSIILNLVRLRQPISRVDLSNRTGIFRSSVSAIVDDLVRDGLLIEERAIPKGRGRVPVNLFLNPNGFSVLGVSIRAFQTKVAAAGLTGEIRCSVSFPTPQDPAAWIKEFAKALKRIRSEAIDPFREIGISVPGMVNQQTGEILMTPALPQYAGFPIAREVSDLAGAEATAENDSNVGALAELWLHETEMAGIRDLVFIEVGDLGVGAGLMIRGDLYTGHDHTWVGEFGHMIIDPSGPPCNCGRRGCWELYVCDRATWQRYEPQIAYTPERFQQLIQLAQEGDARAARAFRATAEYLSLGISNIILGLNPQRVVIAGEIAKVWGLIQHTVESAYAAGRVQFHVYPARFVPEVLSLQGSIVLALQHAFAPPKLG
jgi:predicted NBD/HSP70 family sugar kinase